MFMRVALAQVEVLWKTYNGRCLWRCLRFSETRQGTISFKCNSSTCEGIRGTCTGWYFEELYVCGNGHFTSRMLVWIWSCSYCENNFNRPMDSIPTSCKYEASSRYELNCGKTEGKYYDSNGNEVSPICGNIVVSLTPTHTNQTVYINDSLITTCRAVYKDGSERTVVAQTDFQQLLSERKI